MTNCDDFLRNLSRFASIAFIEIPKKVAKEIAGAANNRLHIEARRIAVYQLLTVNFAISPGRKNFGICLRKYLHFQVQKMDFRMSGSNGCFEVVFYYF
jgi:hypothetical protein